MMKEVADISAVDVFCGVGGLTRGLSDAGVKVELGIDIDPKCALPYERNNDAKFLEADVVSLKPAIIKKAWPEGSVSLLAGCAPCQPFSTYSRKAKRSDVRRTGRGKSDDWQLVKRFGELVVQTEPDLVTMENVPPLAQAEVFKDFLAMLDGYHVDWRVVQCRRIGLPQTRSRLVLVASKLGPIFIPDYDRPATTVREMIEGLPALEAGGIDPIDSLHRASRLSETNLRRIRASRPGGTWRDWPDSLRAACHRQATGETYPSVYGRMKWDEPAPTITTQCFGYGNGRFGHPAQDRAISLREAAILQGFPADYAFVEEGDRVSFAIMGRLIGNAVPVTLGRVIGELMLEHVERQS